jgi:hypothetical protein
MSNARNIANIPNGDDAPVYGCRAWVVFNGNLKEAGVGVPSSSGDDVYIRNSSSNISSVEWTNTGKYLISFSPSLGSTEYSFSGTGIWQGTAGNDTTIQVSGLEGYLPSASALRIVVSYEGNPGIPINSHYVAVFIIY